MRRRRFFIIVLLAVAAGACSVVSVSPTSPEAVSPQIFAEGLPLIWLPALECSPRRPFPAVAGTAPQRTVLMDRDAASFLYGGAPVLSAFWPVSEVRSEPNRILQNFIVGDFIAQDGQWKICVWEEMLREQIFCNEDLCP